MIVLKNFICVPFISAMLYSCNSHQSKVHVKPGTVNSVTDSDRKDSLAMAQIEVLPEYKHLLKWYNRTNKDTSRHIAVLLDERPKQGNNYYQISVGENTPDHFVNMMQFYIDAKDQSIKYLDVETDSLITLKQWRNSGKDEWK